MSVSTPHSERTTRQYSAPALEKGLDILELLADEPQGLTLKAISDRLERSSSELYRMLASLERRRYLHRTSPGESYRLTGKLFELSHRHPPIRRLLDTALPVMRNVAEACQQSCQLATLHDGQVLVAAQVDSPQPISLAVRPGSRMPIASTTSGLVLLAFGAESLWQENVKDLLTASGAGDDTRRRIATIRARGFARMRSKIVVGVIDLSFPVFDHTGHAVAALTMPFLVARHHPRSTSVAETQLSEGARIISHALGAGEAA